MKIFLLVISVVVLCFFQDCKEKEVPKKLGRVSGRLLDSCTGLPQSGIELQFWQNFQKTSSVFQEDIPAERLATFKTDKNGHFDFEMIKNVSYGSIRFYGTQISFLLADGDFGLNNFEGTLNIGDLYLRSDSKIAVLQFKNDRKFEAGDKIVMGYTNPITGEMQWDTITGHWKPFGKWRKGCISKASGSKP